MNIHGYKLKHKGIVSLLKNNPSPSKLKRLEEAKSNCSSKIKELKKARKKKIKKWIYFIKYFLMLGYGYCGYWFQLYLFCLFIIVLNF